ncbi:hypothetical protein [Flavonifractor plautii]|jgi:DGQHR domain-containing protein|uniref:hypothetical protein n=1 Tax=Flavonifractor plautii TaxID=292800 RepID=UPI00214D07FD|nr:hypothetical protein [Flavonifractor plautii]MCR1908669.1 hypothetical protein [Flavonifractor plautii]
MKRMFTKSKTKADILSMLDRMIAQHGDAMSIPMLRVDQSDHLKLYTCALATGFLQAMICRLPRSLENPEGIQRALVMKKVSEIEERLSSGPYGFPNAIVITLRCQDSPYITVAPLESRTSDSSGIVLLTVALHRYREHIAACAADEAGYLLAPEQELLGYMIDGHHRTEGAYAAGKLDYPFLTGVYLDLDLRKMAASFAEINCNQEKPSAIHTNAIRNLSGLMSDRENTAFDLMDELNGRAGLFHDRIKMFDGPRARSLPRAYVNSSKMQKLLEHWLEINLQNGFNYTTFSARVEAIETYFSAWKACYPQAWDSSAHVLTKTMGIDILFDLYGLLSEFMRSSILAPGALPEREDFITAIHRCFFDLQEQDGAAFYLPKRLELDAQSGESIPLTWESSTFGGLSSGKGIHFLKGKLREMIALTRHSFPVH